MAGGWSSLPADLLGDVSDRLLSDADHLHIHQVCTHWRKFTCPPSACRPWVVARLARGDKFAPIGKYSLRLLQGARRVEFRAPAGLPYCRGASCGWLGLMDDERSPTRLVLWEPLSDTEISLPCLNPDTQVFLSGDPLSSSDWIAVASQPRGTIAQKTLFWRRGDDGWNLLYERGTFRIDTVAFHGGKVYCIDTVYNVVICDLIGPASPPNCVRIRDADVGCAIFPHGGYGGLPGAHLVTCNGDLLFVVLHGGSQPSPAEVFKPEWTPDRQLKLQERVTHLGEYSLFVGRGSALALICKGVSCN